MNSLVANLPGVWHIHPSGRLSSADNPASAGSLDRVDHAKDHLDRSRSVRALGAFGSTGCHNAATDHEPM